MMSSGSLVAMSRLHQWPCFELDDASRLIIAPSFFNGQAQHNFCLAPQGTNERMKLWARLVEKKQRKGFNHSYWHQVALWPQGAEPKRVFFVGCRPDDWTKTQSGTQEFNWKTWQHSFEEATYLGHLGRYWATTENGEARVLRLDASDWGFSNPFVVGSQGRFVWRPKDDQTPRRVKDLRFMQVSNADFEKQILAQWNNSQSPIRLESDWRDFSTEQRDAIAFRCNNGDWEEFMRLARLVLSARMGFRNPGWDNLYWKFFIYVPTSIGSTQNENEPVLENDPFLVSWRRTLFDSFRPVYARYIGFSDDIPECVRTHFYSSNPRTKVKVEPSQHEILEARFELEGWARDNLSQVHVDELLAFR